MESVDRGKEFSRLVAIELVAEGRRLGLTQKQMAAAIGVGEAQMSLYTKGKRGNMTVAHLVSGCEALGITPQLITARAYRNLQPVDAHQNLAAPDTWALAADRTNRSTDRERFETEHPTDGYA